MATHEPRRPGFTAVELMILLAIGAVAVGLAVPAVLKARAAQARAQTIDHLAQVGKATQNYAGQYNTKMPFDGLALPDGKKVSIFYQLLPFVGQRGVYDSNAVAAVIPAYLSPQDFSRSSGQVGGLGATNFAGNGALFAGTQARLPASFNPMGTSNVVMYGTRYAVCGSANCAWSDLGANTLFATAYPQFGVEPGSCTTAAVNGFTTAEVHVCMGDASVQTIRPGVDAGTWSIVINPKYSQSYHQHDSPP
jgi:Tfp pilus assembly protein PilE